IKILKKREGIPKCKLFVKEQELTLPFTHELKIQGKSAQRIGVVTLNPLTEGPTILVATHVLDGGLHTTEHDRKILSAEKLRPYTAKTAQRTSYKTSELLGKCGLHASSRIDPKASEKIEDKSAEILMVK